MPPPAPQPDSSSLWEQYRRDPTPAVRTELMTRHLGLVRIIAHKLHEKLHDKVEVEDLIQAGIFGLAESIDRYDTAAGVKFESFASARVRGAMLDHLREWDWVPPHYRQRHGEPARMESFNVQARDGKQRVTEMEDDHARRDAADVDGQDLIDTLIHRLPPGTHQDAARLYFQDGMFMHEIGARLGIKEAAVSRNITQSIGLLRETRAARQLADSFVATGANVS